MSLPKMAALSLAMVALTAGFTRPTTGIGDTFSVRVPLQISLFVPCANGGAGEDVIVSGTLHIVSTFTQSASGIIRAKTHFQPQGASGAGVITGTKYHANGVTQETIGIGPTFTDTFVNNFRFIGQGPNNNFTTHENFHVTVNANGSITVLHDNLTVECK